MEYAIDPHVKDKNGSLVSVGDVVTARGRKATVLQIVLEHPAPEPAVIEALKSSPAALEAVFENANFSALVQFGPNDEARVSTKELEKA